MYTNILNSLKNFILIGDNMNVDFYNDKFKNQPVIKCYQNEKKINETREKNEIHVVRQKDSLFWSFYIMKNGLLNGNQKKVKILIGLKMT